jgi:hypothetical protein
MELLVVFEIRLMQKVQANFVYGTGHFSLLLISPNTSRQLIAHTAATAARVEGESIRAGRCCRRRRACGR